MRADKARSARHAPRACFAEEIREVLHEGNESQAEREGMPRAVGYSSSRDEGGRGDEALHRQADALPVARAHDELDGDASIDRGIHDRETLERLDRGAARGVSCLLSAAAPTELRSIE